MKKNGNRIAFAFFAISLLLNHPLSSSASCWQTDKKIEIELNKLYKKYPLPGSAQEIPLIRFFPSEEMMQKEIWLKGGGALNKDRDGNIYVTDRKLGRILMFDMEGKFINGIGKQGQGPGDLDDPRDVVFNGQGNLIVFEGGTMRIQFMDSRGGYKHSFKVFEPYKRFDIYGDYLYFTNNENRKKENIIDIIDLKGRFIRQIVPQLEFGKVTDYAWAHAPIGNYISFSKKGELYVTWGLFNEVHKYDLDGRLISRCQIEYNKLTEKNEINLRLLRSSKKGIRYEILFVGIQAKENGFYIFSPYPRIEILECSDDGEIINFYWAREPMLFICNDFLVSEEDNCLFIYVLQSWPESVVTLYKTNINFIPK